MKDKLNIKSLNEIIEISKNILKIGLVIAIILLIILISNVSKELRIIPILLTTLKLFSPLLIGYVIAWLFAPVVKFLERKKIPKIFACILVYILVFGGIGLLLYLVIPPFATQIKDFINTTPSIINSAKEMINNFFLSLQNNTSYNLLSTKAHLLKKLETIATDITTQLPNNLLNLVKNIFNSGMFFVLGIIIGFYLLYDFDKINNYFVKILPKKLQSSSKELFNRINDSLRNYVQGIFIVMFLVFITQTVGLTLAGLPSPLVFALICALTDIIPYFGPYIGAIPAIFVGFAINQYVGCYTIISIIVVQTLENNFYQPIIMGKTMKLHPVTIMLGLLIFQSLFGIIGIIIATPVISSLKIVFKFIDEKTDIVNNIRNKLGNIDEENC